MTGSSSKSFNVGVSVIYAAINVVVMVGFARGEFGPVPFELIWTFLAVSVAAGVASLLLPRFGVSWTEALVVLTLFAALSAFNVWCLYAASAAV